MTMGTCLHCGTRITTLRTFWVHLEDNIGEAHSAVPDPDAKKADTAARAKRRKGGRA